MVNNNSTDNTTQHGIDDNPSGDAEEGAALGGLGGIAVGAAAGSLAGPVGTVIGAVVGGISGALASGAAVAAVDAVDNDNSVSGVGNGHTSDLNSGHYETGTYASPNTHGHNAVTGDHADTDAGKSGLASGAVVGGLIGTAVGGPVGAVVGGTLGSLAGGVAGDASEAVAETPASHSTNSHHSGYATGADPDLNVQSGHLNSAAPTGGYYGNYNGRDITRAEYDALPNDDRLRVRLLQEELHVDKQERQVGEVEVSKRVVSEQVQVPVTLEREEVVITRRAVNGVSASNESIGDSETIVVPVREEFANVTKTAHVAEEIEIERRVVSDQKTVSDTVRHEELEVGGTQSGRVHMEGQNRAV